MCVETENKKGFSLIELLVVIGIIAVMAAIAFVFLGGVRGRAGDAKRLNDIDQIGRFLAFGCPVPDGGPGAYDLNELLAELKTKYPQYASSIPADIRDPKTGTAAQSNYKYILDENGNCVLCANLEKDKTKVTLPAISAPKPGGGKGVFAAPAPGWNGSNKYFQVSN
jgi:prepilin-type N-terminal cleavage/methylation domain-containing protein